MSSALERLKQVKSELSGEKPSPQVTTRTFLAWFNAQRRGYNIVSHIRWCLRQVGLVTVPDFESAYIDSYLQFAHAPQPEKAKRTKAADAEAEGQASSEQTNGDPAKEAAQDPTYRISKLAAANQRVVSVKPDAPLTEAVTAMMAYDFSQLPVMTSEREVKGVISWKSIGERVGLGVNGEAVREFMEAYEEVPHHASMFDVISKVIASDYVLVRAEDRSVSGIITASDLSLQFKNLSEPFLLLSEIENLLRGMIEGQFSNDELKSSCDPSDASRQVNGVADLTFGEYIRLLENEERWGKFDVPIDRALFCKNLDGVRRIRNDVMHFDPDGVSEDDLETLRDFARFIKKITALRPRTR